jgi:DNA-binding MarR family transcriptional regulator
MSGELAYELHAVTAKLDRAADRLLQRYFDMSYSRFLALFMVGRVGATTQRSLAGRLGISEPSVSRMAGVLSEAGLLSVVAQPGAGNRKQLELTTAGTRLVEAAAAMLGEHLSVVVGASGVPTQRYLSETRRLSAALDDAERAATSDEAVDGRS